MIIFEFKLFVFVGNDFLNHTNKRYVPRPCRLRRKKCKHVYHTPCLSPCLEEELKVSGLVTTSLNVSPEHCTQSMETIDGSFYGAQSLMPPGPPTSPVSSPPPAISNRGYHSDLSMDDSQVEPPATNRPVLMCNRFRKRRNAICANSSLGRGLREFFSSYVVSSLTDSMTSSLTLENPTIISDNSTNCLIDSEASYDNL